MVNCVGGTVGQGPGSFKADDSKTQERQTMVMRTSMMGELWKGTEGNTSICGMMEWPVVH